MKFQFDQFLGARGSYAPKVSIRNTGQIGLSQGFLRRTGISAGQWYAQLFYDAKNKAVGIKFTQDAEAKGAVRVQKRAVTSADGVENWSGHIPARAFFDFYGIEYRKRERRGYRPCFESEPGMAVIVIEDLQDWPDADEQAEGEKAGEEKAT